MCSNSFWILEAQFWVKTVIRSNGCQCNCKDEVLRAEFGENDEQAPAESHASADGVAAIGAEAWESQACYGVNFEKQTDLLQDVFGGIINEIPGRSQARSPASQCRACRK